VAFGAGLAITCIPSLGSLSDEGFEKKILPSHKCLLFIFSQHAFPLWQKPPKLALDRLSSREKRSSKTRKEPGSVPWRGSDPVPKDTWRFNYLENDEIVKEVQRM
jgi:hypothetical protein